MLFSDYSSLNITLKLYPRRLIVLEEEFPQETNLSFMYVGWGKYSILTFPNVAQMVKNPPAGVIPGWGRPLEKGIAIPLQYSFLPSWWGCKRVRHNLATNSYYCGPVESLGTIWNDKIETEFPE